MHFEVGLRLEWLAVKSMILVLLPLNASSATNQPQP